MHRKIILVVLTVLLAADAAACRCEQKNLQQYFAAAELVVMARLQSADTFADGASVALEFELLAAPYKGVHAGRALLATTATESAACGVVAEVDAIYVVFAYRDTSKASTWRVDTCSGTRVHFSASRPESAGFVDVPARYVASQLNAMHGMEVLGDVAANAPDVNDPENTRFIGLLDLKALAHGGSTRVFAQAAAHSELIATVSDYSALITEELDYERPAAVVLTRADDWYRVQLADGRDGWIAADEAGTWFAYDTLPIRRLAYLNSAWSGLVWPGAGAGLPRRGTDFEDTESTEHPAEIVESVRIGGALWFRVNVLATDPCINGTSTPRLSGWVPGYGRDGERTVGYYSRGC